MVRKVEPCRRLPVMKVGATPNLVGSDIFRRATLSLGLPFCIVLQNRSLICQTIDLINKLSVARTIEFSKSNSNAVSHFGCSSRFTLGTHNERPRQIDRLR
jgi:hypothetical protein